MNTITSPSLLPEGWEARQSTKILVNMFPATGCILKLSGASKCCLLRTKESPVTQELMRGSVPGTDVKDQMTISYHIAYSMCCTLS